MNGQLVNQRSEFDCIGASLAMFFDVDYDVILNLPFMSDYKFDRPISDWEENSIFNHFKARCIYFPAWLLPPGKTKAIVSSPSLNQPGKDHAIFYDGKGFLDPQHGRKDKKFYNYDSSPNVNALTLDLNDLKSVKCVSDHLWTISHKMSEALKGVK